MLLILLKKQRSIILLVLLHFVESIFVFISLSSKTLLSNKNLLFPLNPQNKLNKTPSTDYSTLVYQACVRIEELTAECNASVQLYGKLFYPKGESSSVVYLGEWQPGRTKHFWFPISVQDVRRDDVMKIRFLQNIFIENCVLF